MRFVQVKIWGILLLAFFSLCGCHSVTERGDFAMQSREIEKKKSYSLPQNANTALRHILASDIARYTGKSGFRVFDKGINSLYARLALLQAAEKSIDLQYYAVANDATSNLMIEGIIRAAERGVHIRLLVDGFTVAKMKDGLQALQGNKNIEVRVFNPTEFVNEGLFTKTFYKIYDFDRMNRRMHNKALISDSQMAIVGGRNLGDEYFDAHVDVSFKDIDILTAGPITWDIAQSFDEYWNDQYAYPVEAIYDFKESEAIKAREKLKENWENRIVKYANVYNFDRPLGDVFRDERVSFEWADAKFTADDPLKSRPDKIIKSDPLKELMDAAEGADKEFIAISSYFVPTDKGVKWLEEIHNRGVKVRILTNSLASTDVVAVYSGYEKYIKPLLLAGIELYEFKPVNRERKQRLFARTAPPKAGLHSKLYLVDERYTLVGSFNMDPRSVNLNTELMLIIDSEKIARQLRKGFEETIKPESSYKLILKGGGNAQKIVWAHEKKNAAIEESSSPEASVWRRAQNFLFSLVSLDNNL